MLTLAAGLCTGIGSCIAFMQKRTNRKFLSVSLGFSAGVMIYVSMVEIFPAARGMLAAPLGADGAAGRRQRRFLPECSSSPSSTG